MLLPPGDIWQHLETGVHNQRQGVVGIRRIGPGVLVSHPTAHNKELSAPNIDGARPEHSTRQPAIPLLVGPQKVLQQRELKAA